MGTYGGAVANPLNALATILASLKGKDGKIQLAGFYDQVRPLAAWEQAEFAALAFSEAAFQADSAVTSLEGEAGYTTIERKWARPTCDVNGIFGGYSGPGPKTVLPCKAGASSASAWSPIRTHRRSNGSSASMLRRYARQA